MYHVERKGSGAGEFIRLVDAAAGTRADVSTVGFNCFSFVCPVKGVERDFLFAEPGFPAEGKATRNGTPILAPFPNRIRNGKFTWAGKGYELPLNGDGGKNAIHGFAVDQPWRIVGEGTDGGAWVRGEFQLGRDRADYAGRWPVDFRLRATWRLRGLQLLVEFSVENLGEAELPFGLGTHQYFRFPLDLATPLSECEVVVPASKLVALDACLPTGVIQGVDESNDLRNGMPLDARTFDDVYTGLEEDDVGEIVHSIRDNAAGATLHLVHNADFPYTVVYTPGHRQAVCIEPYTCVTDAINLPANFEPDGPSTGWLTIAAGGRREFVLLHEVEIG